MVYSEAGPSRAPHPAFPSVAPQIPQNMQIPPSPTHLWKQIVDASTPQLLTDLTALLGVLAPPKAGTEDVCRDLLLLEGIDLTRVPDAQIPAVTLGLVYIL